MRRIRSTRWWWLCSAASAVLFLPACSPPSDVLTAPPPAGGTKLPILSEIALIVDAQVNGHAARVVLDTGTVLTSMASPEAVGRLGLEAAGENIFAGAEEGGVGVCGGSAAVLDPTRYVAGRLELGDVVFENVALTVMHETGYDTFAETGVDLILAAEFLMYTDWKVDDGGRRLTLLPLNSRERPAGAVDMQVVGPVSPAPFVDAKIGVMSFMASFNGAAPRQTLPDTGAGILAAVSDQVAQEDGWDPDALPHVERQVFGAGADCSEVLFRGTQLTLGGQAYPRPQVLEIRDGGPLALVGWSFFSSHESVYVAPAGQWIEFAKSATTEALVAEPRRTFGMEVLFNPGGEYEISGVLEGFSAAQEGVRPGEIVLAVNGVNVDTVEGKSLLFGPTPGRESQADFLIQDSSAARRTVTLTAQVELE